MEKLVNPRLAVLVALFFMQGGCAATLSVAHSQKFPLGQGFHSHVEPLGPQEGRVRVGLFPYDAAPGELPPDQEQPPPQTALPLDPPVNSTPAVPPGPPSAAPEAPQTEEERPVGPPYGTKPLHFRCSIQERSKKEKHLKSWYIWDVGEKCAMAIVGLTELALVAAFVHEAGRHHSDVDKVAYYSGAAIMAADAVGLVALMVFAPPQRQQVEQEHIGIWRNQDEACPKGLEIQKSGHVFAVNQAGYLAASDEAWLVWDLIHHGGKMVVRAGGSTEEISLDLATRCRWAEQRYYNVPEVCLQLQARPRKPGEVLLSLW